MRKTKFSIRLTSLMLVFMILFSLWNPSMFALGEKDQGEEEQDKPMQVEVINEDKEEDGSDQDQEEVKENPKKEEPEKEEVKEDKKENEPRKEEKPGDKENDRKEIIEDVIYDELAENVPPVMYNPFISIPMMRSTMSNGGLEDTIGVDKTAERIKGLCRVFEVTLDITGTPQEAPVDVVMIIDKSGSMNESTTNHVPITSAPTANSYYVKINGNYQQVTRHSGSGANSVYRYGVSNNRRYVKWDPNGNDNSGGNSNSSNPLGKPFYLRETGSRLHFAKQAAVNFAAKVLGSNGIAGSRVSLVTFSGPSTVYGYGSQSQAQTVSGLTNNLTQLTNSINGISAGGGTNTEAGFLQGRGVIENSNNPNSNKVVIMFTDGLPTASNGNLYAESTNVNHIHNQRAIAAGKAIYQDGVADVFTIGLLQGMNTAERNLALHILEETQNKGWYEAPTAADLDQIFNDIAGQLGYAATNAKVVDKIGDNFDLIESSLPAGATYNAATREITWNPGTIVTGASLTYKVVAKPDFPGGPADTNEFAKLTYKDIFGNDNQEKVFPVPEVNVPTLLEVELSDTTIILGETVKLGTGTDPNGENYMDIFGGDGDGTYTYEWRVRGEDEIISTAKNPEVTPEEDTVYELTVIDSNGCRAVADMTVFVTKTINITVEKQVTGNYGDQTEEFDFTLTINNVDNNFKLNHGQKNGNFTNIPVDSTVTLKEEDAGYDSVIVEANGKVIDLEDGVYKIPLGNEDIIILVTNHKEVEVDTGISLDTLPYILVIALAAGGLGFMIVRRRKLDH